MFPKILRSGPFGLLDGDLGPARDPRYIALHGHRFLHVHFNMTPLELFKSLPQLPALGLLVEYRMGNEARDGTPGNHAATTELRRETVRIGTRTGYDLG